MTRRVRCAVYTRKSTEDGLEQAFNSLDAQREACEAYVKSQTGEGWVLLREAHDDGGYSGGTLDRPALQRLMDEVDRGRVDIVVVYKIDRLTRSLADFAKLVQRFEAQNVSFVSVTQSFNTTTSMGRLTLNMLLSFAQFEREVTAERIRDKIVASRAKGIFMGGTPPLGYDARDRKLVINEAEAKTVRYIFKRYLELNSIAHLRAELDAKGIRTKAWTAASTGRPMGGNRWHVGPLRSLLRNRVYVGEAVHKGKAYPGEHELIVTRELFDAVQERIDANRVAYKRKTTIGSKGLLTGLIFDSAGHAMTPKTSRKPDGSTYLYYVSQASLQRIDREGTVKPISARVIEGLVCDRLVRILSLEADSRSARSDIVGSETDPRPLIRELITRVELGTDQVEIFFSMTALADRMNASVDAVEEQLRRKVSDSDQVERSEDTLKLIMTCPLKRLGASLGIEVWDREDWFSSKPRVDRVLVKALVRAHLWRDMLEAGEVTTLRELAKTAGLELCHVRELLRLAFLAPEIQRALLEGRHHRSLSLASVAARAAFLGWTDQIAVQPA